MKFRSIGIAIVLVALFVVAALQDTPAVSTEQVTNVMPGKETETSSSDILQGCESYQGGSIGPLVPDQGTPQPVATQVQTAPAKPIPHTDLSLRAGFSISTPTDPEYWAGLLGSAWYLDWSIRDGLLANGLERWQMVRVHEECVIPAPEAIKSTAASYPGQVWIIGNEPDVIWQDNVTPAKYAVFYHELYFLIKSADPTALIAVGGIAQATPLRFQYLNQVLETYKDLYHALMPADWWTVHGYVLREEKGSWGVEIPPGLDATQGELYEVSDHGRLDLFENQLVAFRKWMAENGYQHTPLALTEFGILMPTSYGFPTEMIADYLEQTFTWLYKAKDVSVGYPEDSFRLIQKWAWFSLSDPTYPSSNLGDLSNNQLTIIGERFQNVVSYMHP